MGKKILSFRSVQVDSLSEFLFQNYVKAHCGILGNERADALAKQGGEMYRKGLRSWVRRFESFDVMFWFVLLWLNIQEKMHF